MIGSVLMSISSRCDFFEKEYQRMSMTLEKNLKKVDCVIIIEYFVVLVCACLRSCLSDNNFQVHGHCYAWCDKSLQFIDIN